MKANLPVVFITAALTVIAALAFVNTHGRARRPKANDEQPSPKTEPAVPEITSKAADNRSQPPRNPPLDTAPTGAVTASGTATTNKLQRLAETRNRFQALAAGDPATALQAAKQILDEVERETALITLVTEWTRGELRSPRERAQAIAMYGLEAGLGIEITGNPELAVSWANELTTGSGREALLRQIAISLAGTDPASAFALGNQLPDDQKRRFFDSVFAGWGGQDTEAALQWANQLPDPAERDGAIQAIRTAAPVGIGTAIAMKDGYPVVAQLFPGTPAELSGQIQRGDRIVALAQGDNAFVDAHSVSLNELVQMIRGAPGTTVQLQVVSADAPPDAQPRTISITRDQLKFKR